MRIWYVVNFPCTDLLMMLIARIPGAETCLCHPCHGNRQSIFQSRPQIGPSSNLHRSWIYLRAVAHECIVFRPCGLPVRDNASLTHNMAQSALRVLLPYDSLDCVCVHCVSLIVVVPQAVRGYAARRAPSGPRRASIIATLQQNRSHHHGNC